MAQAIQFEVNVPDDLATFRLPVAVQRRLTDLLDRQDQGHDLSEQERSEAEGHSRISLRCSSCAPKGQMVNRNSVAQ